MAKYKKETKPLIQPIRMQPDYGESGMNARIEELREELEEDSIKTAKLLDQIDDCKRRRGRVIFSYLSWEDYKEQHPDTDFKNEEEYLRAMGDENKEPLQDKDKEELKGISEEMRNGRDSNNHVLHKQLLVLTQGLPKEEDP